MVPHPPTTSVNRNHAINEEAGHITVLVTGFGPFQAAYPINPSFSICKALPKTLPQTHAGDSAVRIISHDAAIRVAYAECPMSALLEAHAGAVDLVLHIGMASGRTYYTAEKYAHSTGYTKYKDVDGRFAPPPDDDDSDVPGKVSTSLDFEDVVDSWQDAIRAIPREESGHDADVRPSENAGYFLCDYTYFTSLKWFGRSNACMRDGSVRSRPVLFFHVPPESDEKSLDAGVVVCEQLIRAMVRSFVRQAGAEGTEVA